MIPTHKFLVVVTAVRNLAEYYPMSRVGEGTEFHLVTQGVFQCLLTDDVFDHLAAAMGADKEAFGFSRAAELTPAQQNGLGPEAWLHLVDQHEVLGSKWGQAVIKADRELAERAIAKEMC